MAPETVPTCSYLIAGIYWCSAGMARQLDSGADLAVEPFSAETPSDLSGKLAPPDFNSCVVPASFCSFSTYSLLLPFPRLAETSAGTNTNTTIARRVIVFFIQQTAKSSHISHISAFSVQLPQRQCRILMQPLLQNPCVAAIAPTPGQCLPATRAGRTT